MQVLKVLGVGLAVFVILAAPGASQYILKGTQKAWDKRALNRTLGRLRKRGLAHFFQRKDGALVVELTENGRKYLSIYRSGEIELEHKRFDGYWYVVFFDIPEFQKRAREALRRKLRAWGLYRLQRSVYVTPCPCEKEVGLLKNLFELADDTVFVLKTKVIPKQELLRKYFSL